MYAACVVLGVLHGDSVLLLDDIEREIIQDGLTKRRVSAKGRKYESIRRGARRYRQRRPVRTQLSIFFHAEVGMEADFLMVFFESTMNWLFMVTIPPHID